MKRKQRIKSTWWKNVKPTSSYFLKNKKMYRQRKMSKTTINRNESFVGETLEQKVYRITNNKEPITDGAPQIYTDRKDGVPPEYDIRTDMMEVALDAMDKVTSTIRGKRENKPNLGEQAKDGMNKEGDDKIKPIQATGDENTHQ